MYHFGVSGIVIWSSHILMGSFFAYVGYLTLNKKEIPQIVSLALIVLGVLGLLYHLHLMVYKSHRKIELSKQDDNNNNSKIISTYKGKKYDLTDWNRLHPGGPVLDKANGRDLEEVWKENGVGWHLKNKRVMKTLEKYLIK